MIDEDILTLQEQLPDKALDCLEADVWAGVTAHGLAHRTSRIIASCQIGVMVATLAGAAAAGAATAASTLSDHTVIAASGAELAPSTLLLGTRP